ncbi:MAG: ATP-binding protein [Anaeroplasmataceae bacterium]
MNKRRPILIFLIVLIIEIIVAIIIINNSLSYRQDSVEINRIYNYINTLDDYNTLNYDFEYDYTIVLSDGTIYQQSNMSNSIADAIVHGDTILDIIKDDKLIGHLIINNDMDTIYKHNISLIVGLSIGFLVIDFILVLSYYIYLKRRILDPFKKLESFARSVAFGNLDTPLLMDKGNAFGAFSEAFDILRSELKASREAEAKANESKKELIAKLSHDIKTPVASIMATSELELIKNKDNKSFNIIYSKALQLNSLVNNLFESSIADVSQLDIEVTDIEASRIKDIILASDYKKYANIMDIPDCIIKADELRLAQVIDNIISNSYKYADTKIDISFYFDDKFLVVKIKDYGPGCPNDDLAVIKTKYVRGSNSNGKTGAGLGLYLADDFLTRMGGSLDCLNEDGFLCVIKLLLS